MTAQAVLITQCESGWNASTRMFGGRYVLEAHPRLGRTVTEEGLLMLPRRSAES